MPLAALQNGWNSNQKNTPSFIVGTESLISTPTDIGDLHTTKNMSHFLSVGHKRQIQGLHPQLIIFSVTSHWTLLLDILGKIIAFFQKTKN